MISYGWGIVGFLLGWVVRGLMEALVKKATKKAKS